MLRCLPSAGMRQGNGCEPSPGASKDIRRERLSFTEKPLRRRTVRENVQHVVGVGLSIAGG